MTDQERVDAIKGMWLKTCGLCDAGMPEFPCTCPQGDPRVDMSYLVTRLERQEAQLTSGEASDGHHTHNELYRYRMLYHAHSVMWWRAIGVQVVKSWKHHDGEPCFGGGWFIVSAELPTGQISNHYRADDWDMFDCPEAERAPEWDGHTPEEAADRLMTTILGYVLSRRIMEKNKDA